MTKKFETLLFVKSSLISLYVALTIPIPFISSQRLKIYSIIAFVLGLFLIINSVNDYVNTCNKKITYKTSFISKVFGKKNWEIYWKDIASIRSYPTSQGSKVHYFITNKNNSFLIPQRIEDFENFLFIVKSNTKLKIDEINYISPLWTYKLLTFLSIFMILGEILAFVI